jgi:hypothetical protein
MTTDALGGCSGILMFREILMTCQTAYRRMTSKERESRQLMFLCHVRNLPRLHCVASQALVSLIAFVRVCVTIGANRTCIGKSNFRMALAADERLMATGECKSGLCVPEE